MSDADSFFNEVREKSNKKLDECIKKIKYDMCEAVKRGMDCISVNEYPYQRIILEKKLGSMFVVNNVHIFLRPDVDEIVANSRIVDDILRFLQTDQIPSSREDMEVISDVAVSVDFHLKSVKRQITKEADAGKLWCDQSTRFPLFLKRRLGNMFSYVERPDGLTISWTML